MPFASTSRITGDEESLGRYGAEILVETARLWYDLGFFSERKGGRFCIHSVTGPDEYSTVVDNNTYTNLMAARNLRYAADTAERWPNELQAFELTPAEIADWRKADQSMAMPFDTRLGVHQQDLGSTEREVWDFASSAATQAA